jgi:hypothetical protein
MQHSDPASGLESLNSLQQKLRTTCLLRMGNQLHGDRTGMSHGLNDAKTPG